MKKPESVDEAREWLKGLADYLDGVPNASSRLVFGVNAIRGYLNGEHNSLDKAFSVVGNVGRKKRRSKHFDLAYDVFIKKEFEGKSWKVVCDELVENENKYSDDVSNLLNDDRELRRLLKRCHDDIMDKLSDKVRDAFMEKGL